jgi:COMPASS component SWD1
VVDVKTLNILKTFKVTTGGTSVTAVKWVEFARRGTSFLLNCSDRIIRVYDIEDVLLIDVPEDGSLLVDVMPLQRLQDNVNRMQWKKCVFSGDGDYICAGSHRQHELYIWDKSTGNLAKMLTGVKGESLLDLTWHPVRPIILSVSNGVVNVWSHAQTELWSAYAPNFKELDENEDYEERESEFDIEDEDKSVNGHREGGNRAAEDELVDVTEDPIIPAFCSSEEDSESPLNWLPYAPEVEEPEEPGWGQLEPTLNELPSNRKRLRSADDDANLDIAKVPHTIDIELPEGNINSSDNINSKKVSKTKK